MIVGAVLSFLIPIAAVVIFKLKNRDVRLPSALVGAVTFVVFAMILEQLPGLIMLPIVQRNAAAYIIYGALAAGIFEETGRLAAYKFVMTNNLTTKNAIMMGLGHGGFECMLLLGFSTIGFAASAIMVTNNGWETTIANLSGGDANAVESIRAQLEVLTAYNFGDMALSIYERLLAMTIHVCLSVVIFHAVTHIGQMKLYVLAVIIHAAVDVPAAMYQVGMLSLPAVYVILTIITAAVVVFTITITKKFSNYME